MIEDLIAHITPPIKLTRKTLSAIVLRTNNRKAALDNPQEFALHAARIIREKAIEQLVEGIQYFKDGTWYDMTEWVEEEETVSDRLVPVDNSIYDHIVVQSETEKRFVEKLKKRKDVRLFVKLPAWFKVATPVGQYNPDWGLVMDQADAFGDTGPLLYLVRETKSTTVASELRGTENQKNHCGERHFVGALASIIESSLRPTIFHRGLTGSDLSLGPAVAFVPMPETKDLFDMKPIFAGAAIFGYAAYEYRHFWDRWIHPVQKAQFERH